MKKLVKVVVINIIILVIFIFVLELLARILSLGPELDLKKDYSNFKTSKILPFRLNPGECKSRNYGDGEVNFCINKDSFRDKEYEKNKNDSIYRIIGLGASYTYGACVSLKDSYLGLTEEKLNNSLSSAIGKKIEILKYGCAMYYPEMEKLLLKHYALDFNPDAVVIDAMASDVASTYRGMDYMRVSESGYLKTNESKKIGKIGEWLYINSRLGRWILYRYLDQNQDKFKWDEIFKENGFHEKDWKKMEEEYLQISKICKERDMKMLILFIPQMDILTGRSYKNIENRFKIIAKNIGVDFVSSLSSFEGTSEKKIEDLFYIKHQHPNPKGYSLIADHLTSKLEEIIK